MKYIKYFIIAFIIISFAVLRVLGSNDNDCNDRKNKKDKEKDSK